MGRAPDEQEILDLGPAFATYLRRFRPWFGPERPVGHFDTYCRGPSTDLPRKNIELIALAVGAAVPTLHKFLVTPTWGRDRVRDLVPQSLAATVADLPG